MSSPTIRVLADLLEARTGQRLNASRSWRIGAALGPVMAEHRIADLDALAMHVVAPGSGPLADQIVEALLNNETYFFRDAETFGQLTGTVLPQLAARRGERRRLRIWSAGCSTGQELYSITIALNDSPERWAGWEVELIGTDISRAAVERAVRGEYSQFEIQRGLPIRQMLRWFAQDGETWRVDERLRAAVRFRRHNILEPAPPGFFDLVLCRNVLLYFPSATRSAALERIADALAPDGALMLGAGETVLGYSDRFTISPEAKGLYRLKEFPAARRVA